VFGDHAPADAPDSFANLLGGQNAQLAARQLLNEHRRTRREAASLELAGDRNDVAVANAPHLDDLHIVSIYADVHDRDPGLERAPIATSTIGARPPTANQATSTLQNAMGERSPKQMRISVTWFPNDEYDKALATWPELADEWGDVHPEYCRRLEKRMRELTAHGILIRSVAPIWIDKYVAWCNERDDDPAHEGSRAAYAADLERLGGTVPWPPRRNERCWCGSGDKYKSCCGSVGPASPEPLRPV
jgi:hypothetical protein